MPDIAPPRRILMASDLSARTDRALARAVRLSARWNSALTIAHIVRAEDAAHHDTPLDPAPSWHKPLPWVEKVGQVLKADMHDQGITAATRVLVGQPIESVQKAVAEEHAELVILGIAKVGRLPLGKTVDTLARRAQVPLLNVRSRANGPYRHIVIATDFSAPALRALQMAATWFAEASRLTLFHAYPPAGHLRLDPSAPDSLREELHQQAAQHLAQAGLPPEIASRIDIVIEPGIPEKLLPDYVDTLGVDLVVLSSQGRTGLNRVLLGSTSENLLQSLDCDTLLVRGGA